MTAGLSGSMIARIRAGSLTTNSTSATGLRSEELQVSDGSGLWSGRRR
jgi:hypothetical protein